MSVPIRNRSESEIDYVYDAVQLDQAILELALRDFGIKDRIKTVDYYAKVNKMSKEDVEEFQKILDKYGLDSSHILEEYPQWLIDSFRQKLIDTSDRLAYDVSMAWSIEELRKPLTQEEINLRDKGQAMALGECQELFRQMQRIMKTIPVDANKLMPYTGEIIKVKQEIQNWRNQYLEELNNSNK